jgi:hypothetical protein
MDAISSINSFSASINSMPAISQCAGSAQTGSTDAVGGLQSNSSVSKLSISANVQNFMETYGPVMSNNDITGAVLLMLMAEYMKSDDKDEKKGLLGLMMAMMQSQSSGQSSFAYNSSSLSIQSSQFQSGTVDLASTGYSGSPVDTTSTPAADPSAGGLNVVA